MAGGGSGGARVLPLKVQVGYQVGGPDMAWSSGAGWMPHVMAQGCFEVDSPSCFEENPPHTSGVAQQGHGAWDPGSLAALTIEEGTA